MAERNSANETKQQEIQIALGANLVIEGDALPETKERNNAALLGAGRHGKVTTSKPSSTVEGAAGAEVRDQILAKNSVILRGLNIICKGDKPGVKVSDTGRVVMIGCHITKDKNIQAAASSYIRVEAGGSIAVIGCYFHNTQALGFTIDNAGLAANAAVTGCTRETTVGHNNCSVGVEVSI